MISPSDLKQTVFNLIYEEPDLDKGINSALAYVGNAFGISRVYIFENNDTNTHSSNTYEWCAPNIEPQIDELQNMSFAEYDYQSLFDDKGMCFCPNVSVLPEMLKDLFESQGIRATLQYAVYDKGIFRGFVGFDDCASARPEWQDDGVSLNTLVYISRLLSICLLKERNLQNALKLHDELEESLNTEKEMREAAIKATEAKTEFLSRMSHEIRTPMNAIIGMTAIAKDRYSDFKLVNECLDKIDMSSHYLLTLINDILEMSRIESGRTEIYQKEFSFAVFINSIRTVIEPLAVQSNIRYEFINNANPDPLYIGDMVRVEQVLINLLTNAIKFTKANGRVRFSVFITSQTKETANFRFIVADTGIGMSEQFMERMFNPFTQEDGSNTSKYGGSGLGLAISKSLIDAMGGAIKAESFSGVGSTFTVDIPLTRVDYTESAIPEPKQEQVDLQVLNGANILMAEDHPLNVMVAKKLLEQRGVVVNVADNGKMAIDMFVESEIGHYDAILMDIRMPVMDGLDAARAIRALERSDASTIPIIAMTANALDEDRQHSQSAGMDEHLAKPFEPLDLYNVLAKQIGKKRLQ